MALTDKERATAYRRRKMEELRARGDIQIKVITASPAKGAIERIARATSDILRDEPLDVTDEMLEGDLVESFLKSGAPQLIRFEIEGIGAVGVKMVPFRSKPVLLTIVLEGETDLDIYRQQFPILQRLLDLENYLWRTPEYVALCAELGIDHLWHEPKFASEHATLAFDLLEWTNHPMKESGGPNYYIAQHFVFDMLDDIRNGFETQGNSSFWVQLCSRSSHYTD